MTKDEIIEIAKEAVFPIFGTKVVANDPMQQMLADAVTQHYHESAIQFAKLVAAKEREACAKVCDSLEEQCEKLGVPDEKWPTPADCAAVIRARGKA